MNSVVSVASVASATAAAAPSIGNPDQHPDEELLAADREHDRLVRLLEEAKRRVKPQTDAFWEEISALKQKHGRLTDEQYIEASGRVSRRCPVEGPTPDDVMNMTAKQAEAIVSIPARTLEGLKAKAKLARFAFGDRCWDQPDEEMDWDVKVNRALIEAVLTFEAQRG